MLLHKNTSYTIINACQKPVYKPYHIAPFILEFLKLKSTAVYSNGGTKIFCRNF